MYIPKFVRAFKISYELIEVIHKNSKLRSEGLCDLGLEKKEWELDKKYGDLQQKGNFLENKFLVIGGLLRRGKLADIADYSLNSL